MTGVSTCYVFVTTVLNLIYTGNDNVHLKIHGTAGLHCAADNAPETEMKNIFEHFWCNGFAGCRGLVF